MVHYTKLRYRLLPYIYSLAGSAYHDDYTIMRGLTMDFGTDANVKGIGDQYMFGPFILVCPVYVYKARTRELYLPAGTTWYDVDTFEKYEGRNHVTAKAPLDRLPLFIKAGSIIPIGPEIQYTGEKVTDPITLYIFPGANGSFTLYEDEGTNYNYEKGQFASIRIDYDNTKQRVTINERKGEFPGMLVKRRFQIVWVKDHLEGGFTARPQQVVDYDGQEIQITMGTK